MCPGDSTQRHCPFRVIYSSSERPFCYLGELSRVLRRGMTAFFYYEQRMAEVLLSESDYRLMLCGECSSELFYCAAGGGKLLSAGRTFHCNKAPAYANERQAQLTQHR